MRLYYVLTSRYVTINLIENVLLRAGCMLLICSPANGAHLDACILLVGRGQMKRYIYDWGSAQKSTPSDYLSHWFSNIKFLEFFLQKGPFIFIETSKKPLCLHFNYNIHWLTVKLYKSSPSVFTLHVLLLFGHFTPCI